MNPEAFGLTRAGGARTWRTGSAAERTPDSGDGDYLESLGRTDSSRR
jgi:hypothetical protein